MKPAVLSVSLGLLALVSPLTAAAELPPGRVKAVQAMLGKLDSEIKPEHYTAVETDLDEDGRKDVLVLINEKGAETPTGGCTLILLRASKEDHKFTIVGKVGVVCAPVYLRATRHHGIRDLLVRVVGKGKANEKEAVTDKKEGDGAGASGFDYAVVAFDGKCFPKSPGEATAKVEETDKVLFAEQVAEATLVPAPADPALVK
ncbi:MAG: hypothetical protein ACAI34_09100 [Verrucomicrobium sp.]